MSDQRAKRFHSRRSLHLEANGLDNLQKIPVDTVTWGSLTPLIPEPKTSGAAPNVDVVSSAASVLERAPQVEDDDLDLEQMGLPKAAPKPKPKIKRTRDEIAHEDLLKVQQDVQQLAKSCAHLPNQPKGGEFARVDRVINKRLKDAKDNKEFDKATDLNKVLAEFTALRDAVKPCQAYLSGSAPTRKKSAEDWTDVMWPSMFLHQAVHLLVVVNVTSGHVI